MDRKSIVLATTLLAAGCAGVAMHAPQVSKEQVAASLKASFKPNGQATLERLDQDPLQAACTEYANKPLPPEVAKRLEAEQLQLVKLPADGKLLGDWKAGERIAQTGVGLQYSDDPKVPAGGNCY